MQSYPILQPQPSLSEVCRQMRLYPPKSRHSAPEANQPTPATDPARATHRDAAHRGTATI